MNIQLTKFEKAMIVIYFVIIIIMLLNPPWAYFHPETGKFIESLGEKNIFDGVTETKAQIHFSMLLYQIIVIGILMAFAAFVLRSLSKLRKKSKTLKSE